MQKSTQTQQPKLRAIYSTTLREGVRKWLAGASRKTLPGRGELGKNSVPKRYKQVILDVLGLKDWSDAIRLRKQARGAAKRAAKVEQKREAKSDAASQRRAA